jgi:GNAT superfamily N-acetyltransferase
MTDRDIRLQTLTGAAMAPFTDALAQLRITVFREYPYLYDGDAAEERRHLAQFCASAGAALVLALDGDTPVGCATCLPAADERETHAPLRARGADPANVCYFGESVLLPAFRGRGLGVAFFAAREAHARTLPGITTACFAAVRRPPDHPLRPPSYQPLDRFWRKRGFAPWPGPPLSFTWKQVDGPEKMANALDFWVKTL